MKRVLLLAFIAITAGITPCPAANFAIDLSPIGGALNLGSTTYTMDHGLGIAGPNEKGLPSSPATDNEVGAGVNYDDVTNILSFDVAYGSAFGFVDLTSEYDDAHFHSQGPVNFPAANSAGQVIHNLDGFNTSSGDFSGRLTGSVVLTAVEEVELFNNVIYINIHSRDFRSGEIRGQLIPVPEPSGACLLVVLSGVFLTLRRSRMLGVLGGA